MKAKHGSKSLRIKAPEAASTGVLAQVRKRYENAWVIKP
jgi:hypothetical protein